MSLPSMSINVSPMCPDHDMSNACYVVPRKQVFPDVYSAPRGIETKMYLSIFSAFLKKSSSVRFIFLFYEKLFINTTERRFTNHRKFK